MRKTRPSVEIDEKVISLYLSGKDTYQTAEECCCSQTFVMNTLKRHNIPRRTTQSYTTKYISNEKFFDIIDSEERAYVLGFLYADGNNYVKRRCHYEISISLQARDKYILERFRELICPTITLEYIKRQREGWQDQYRLRINNKTISQQLEKLGCVQSKSLILTWPEWLVDIDLQRHFIRGYFDGDGSLWAQKSTETGQINWGWQITSTNTFCYVAKNIVEMHAGVHCSNHLTRAKTNQITTSLSVGGNIQVRRVLDWMYKDATIYLPRKYEKYQKFLAYISPK
jgi:intein/homing endonuclease